MLFIAGAGYGSIIPDASNPQSQQLTKYLGEKVGKLVDQYLDAMEKVIMWSLILTKIQKPPHAHTPQFGD